MFSLPEFNNTTQARIAAEKSRFGIYSSFLTWVDQAEPDDLWPCLIHHDDGPIDFWSSLTLGDKLSDDDRCEFLRHDYFVILHANWGHKPTQALLTGDDINPENSCDSKVVVSHLEFVHFLDDLASQSAEPPNPLRITSAPFDKIYAPEHLLWIRQILNSTGKHKEQLDQKMYALLHEAYKCKLSYWTIQDAIHILLNESTVIYTPSRELKRAEIADWINQAECAARDKVFPSIVDSSGSIVVKPIDILEWAKEYGLEIHPEIESAIKGQVIGNLKPGRPPDAGLERRAKEWRKAAYAMMLSNGRINFIDAARTIYNENKISYGKDVNTIRKELTAIKMEADGWDLTKISKI